MDPLESVVKNPYTSISIPRAHLRPDLEQQLQQSQDTRNPGARPGPAPDCSLPTAGGWTKGEAKGGSQIQTQAPDCSLPTAGGWTKGEAKGGSQIQTQAPDCSLPTAGGWTKGEAKGGSQIQTQASWQQPGNPYGSVKQTSGSTNPPYCNIPPVRRGDDIAHHCCCCPCCRCCRCPRCCRCHSCCCVVS
ncbi:cysteine-rich tail protein 1 [Monodelphis domestica]|uniref:cysteine-rich tail protein 1 n=1 Tax=Monodelphis domestica TaxID=13616 RepID=UPI0024E250D9|nr:cysteine-rich tail protein 1 [Monodelphis domestica]XP_007475510.2 cysteine-rich tail protein 1 [Monodelphis domestica]XP_056679061.1 cysteine-rich tail protein 1 [Monodelphis domestica]